MATPADPFSILNKDPNRGKIVPKKFTKVNRMWAGKAPTFAEGAEEEQPKGQTEINNLPNSPVKQSDEPKESEMEIRKSFTTEIVIETTPAATAAITSTLDDEKEREKIKQQALLEQEAEDPNAFPDIPEDPVVLPQSLPISQPKKLEEEEVVNPQLDASESGEEEETEQKPEEKPLLKPVFVGKDERSTLKEKEKQQLEELVRIEEEKKRKDEMKLETKMMIIRTIKEDNEKKTKPQENADTNMPTDDDDVNETYEYEQWRIRELKRIKRDKEEREEKKKEKEEIERRRKMTEAERQEENKRLGTDESQKPVKSKYHFLQKYYHKGAFFQEKAKEDPNHIFNRDYNLPTAEDRWDKSALPKLLQKRRGNAGKKGNSKYTHLTGEDTTNFDPFFKVPEKIANKMLFKAAGLKGMNQLDRPSRKNYK